MADAPQLTGPRLYRLRPSTWWSSALDFTRSILRASRLLRCVRGGGPAPWRAGGAPLKKPVEKVVTDPRKLAQKLAIKPEPLRFMFADLRPSPRLWPLLCR
jgi:hypothetical protein